MSDNYNEPMLEMYIFETSQIIEQLEQVLITSEKSDEYDEDSINEIFRCMHTIKGSSAMMMFNNIGTLAHSVEDIFYFLREKKPQNIDCSEVSDLIFEAVDFIKIELEKIKSGDDSTESSEEMIANNKNYLQKLKEDNNITEEVKKPKTEKKQQFYIAPEKKIEYDAKHSYKVIIYFQADCEMENVRAFTIVHNLTGFAESIVHQPENLLEDENSAAYINENGFTIFFKSDKDYETVENFFESTLFLREIKIEEIEKPDDVPELQPPEKPKVEIIDNILKIPEVKKTSPPKEKPISSKESASSNQGLISVNVNKLDSLMDMVGEMVIAEQMVIHNPEVEKLSIQSFEKASIQLHKITTELQDMVMSMRMVPLSTTFLKTHRIMRDMTKKLGKDVELIVRGEETEVDKTIIEKISDPLMHIIRNSIDHGIEETEERIRKGKDKTGTIILEAKNSGSDVLIIVKDDGSGLDKEKILKKARDNNLLVKNENEMTDKEIYKLILLPGFSTKESVTEFSGRGVGMDVVVKNLEAIGGSVNVDSTFGKGTTMTLKIPLTLAIIDGMNIKVGTSRYTIPIISVKQSFKPKPSECFTDPDGNEMVMVRGQCYPIIRLHDFFRNNTDILELTDGILVMVEQDDKFICLFADELIGNQQVVVKALPNYVKIIKKIIGLSGCTILSDGSISSILDISALVGLRAD